MYLCHANRYFWNIIFVNISEMYRQERERRQLTDKKSFRKYLLMFISAFEVSWKAAKCSQINLWKGVCGFKTFFISAQSKFGKSFKHFPRKAKFLWKIGVPCQPLPKCELPISITNMPTTITMLLLSIF